MSASSYPQDPLQQQVFRSRFAPLLAYAWYVAAVLLTIDLFDHGDRKEILTGLGALVLITVMLYAGAQRPALIVDNLGVTVRNLVRDIYVPWHEVRRVGAVWSLTIETERGEFHAWAVTATNPNRRRMSRKRAIFGFGPTPPASFDEYGSDELDSLPGLVSTTIALRQERAQKLDPSGETSVRVAWEVLVGLAVGLVLLVAGLLS